MECFGDYFKAIVDQVPTNNSRKVIFKNIILKKTSLVNSMYDSVQESSLYLQIRYLRYGFGNCQPTLCSKPKHFEYNFACTSSVLCNFVL